MRTGGKLSGKISLITVLLLIQACLISLMTVDVHARENAVLGIESLRTGLGANDLGDIEWDGSSLWVSGSGTLNQLIGRGYLVTDWISYQDMAGFGRGTISAFLAEGNTLLTAWVYTRESDGDSRITGDGISVSEDGGETWRHVSILDLFPDRANVTYPGTFTLMYDYDRDGQNVWVATTSGFLFKTADLFQTYTQFLPNTEGVDPDSLEFDFMNFNHHAYCVDAYNDTLWVGTFEGINSSFDGGVTWTNHSWPQDGSGSITDNKYVGNWVYAVEHRVVNGKTHVWVGCSMQGQTHLGTYGIVHTDDNGKTWRYTTTKYNAWNFAFGHNGAVNPLDGSVNQRVNDGTVFAASDSGLVATHDYGDSWSFIPVSDDEGTTWDSGFRVGSVAVANDTLWVSSSDGLARSLDWGETWEVFKGVTRVKALDSGSRDIGISANFDDVQTYAYPNPFSPLRGDPDYASVKIHYAIERDAAITVTIHDYQGRLIRELVTEKQRAGGNDYDEIWDGRDKNGRIVPNGVYFFMIKTDKGDSARDKIMVLD